MAASTDLQALNKSSAKFVSFAVRVLHPHEYEYEFQNKKTNSPIKQKAPKFECVLVSSDEKYYALGFAKGSKDVQTAKQQFTEGSTWTLSKIQFETNRDAAFISTPAKLSVDLIKSNLQRFEDSKALLAKYVVPPRSVAETRTITSTRAQDVMAIVTEVSTPRPTKRGDVVDVTIMDGSQDEGQYAKVSVSVWGEKQKRCTIGKPLVFLNLMCKVTSNEKQVNHWEDSLLLDAPPGQKKDELLKNFDHLKGATNIVTLTTPFQSSQTMDVSGPQNLGAAAFMDFTSKNPDAKLPEIIQIMYCNIEEPTGEVTHESNNQIWFLANLHDFSGNVSVGVPERVALELTSLEKEAFKTTAASGGIQFPLLCNVRISRILKESAHKSDAGANQPSTSNKFVNYTVQQVIPIDWKDTMLPNASYASVIDLLNKYPRHDEGIVFGYLSDIEPNPHYGFQLTFPNGNVVKGAAAVVLIASAHKSEKPVAMGDGFKVITKNVKDAANPDDSSKHGSYSVTGYCTLGDLPKFQLDPLRGQGARHAIAFITTCTKDDSPSGHKHCHLDKLQLLDQGEGANAVAVFQRLRRVTMKVNPESNEGHKHDLDFAEESQQALKKCKTLKSLPTHISLSE